MNLELDPEHGGSCASGPIALGTKATGHSLVEEGPQTPSVSQLLTTLLAQRAGQESKERSLT